MSLWWPGTVDADQDPAAERGGDLLSAAARTSLWSVKVFEPALPVRRSMARHSLVSPPPGPGAVEAPAHLPGGGSCSLLSCSVRGDQGGVHVDGRPPPGPPRPRPARGTRPRPRSAPRHARGSVPWPARSGPASGRWPGPGPRRSRSSRTAPAGPGRAGPPSGDAGHRGHVHTIAIAVDRAPFPCWAAGKPPFQVSAPVQRGGQPALVGELAQQDPPGMADETAASGGDLQGMVPGHPHREGRSSLELLVVTRNLPGRAPFAADPVILPFRRGFPGPCTIQVRPLNAPVQGKSAKPPAQRNAKAGASLTRRMS